jgi:hypothetical protein
MRLHIEYAKNGLCEGKAKHVTASKVILRQNVCEDFLMGFCLQINLTDCVRVCVCVCRYVA